MQTNIKKNVNMKKKIFLWIAAILVAPIFYPVANAALIIDTGPGAATGGAALVSSATGGLNQWLAAKFELNSAQYITDIAGWVDSTGQTGKLFTISVYGGGGEIPDPSNLLYINQATVTGSGGGGWEGYHINWGNGLELAAGSYWLGFEVRSGDTYAGSMPGGSSFPLLDEAYNNYGYWVGSDNLDLGIRISGNQVPVPLPPALWLLGSGLLGLIGMSRHKKAMAAS